LRRRGPAFNRSSLLQLKLHCPGITIEDVRKSDLLAELTDALSDGVSEDLWLLSVGIDNNPWGQCQSLIPNNNNNNNNNNKHIYVRRSTYLISVLIYFKYNEMCFTKIQKFCLTPYDVGRSKISRAAPTSRDFTRPNLRLSSKTVCRGWRGNRPVVSRQVHGGCDKRHSCCPSIMATQMSTTWQTAALFTRLYVKSNEIPLKNRLRRQSQATEVLSLLPWKATVLGEPQQKVEMCLGLQITRFHNKMKHIQHNQRNGFCTCK